MNPDSQNPTQAPDEGTMPAEPTTGMNETPQVPVTGGDEGGDAMPEVPQAPETPEAPAEGDTPVEAPAPDESDKEDGAKW